MMVLGLGGAALPPRPLRARPAAVAGTATRGPEGPAQPQCLARVQSNSGLAALPTANLGGLPTGADAVETPVGEPPLPQQPTISDQSNNEAAAHVGAGGGELASHSAQQWENGRDGQVARGRDAPEQSQASQRGLAGEAAHGEPPQQEQQAALAQQGAEPAGRQAASPAPPAAGAGAAAAAAAAAGGSSFGGGSRKRQRSSSHHQGRRSTHQQAAQHAAGASGRTQRASRLGLAPAAAAAAAAAKSPAPGPASKRHKGAGAGHGSSAGVLHGGHRPSKFADILHNTVVVPGAVFYVDTPGQVYVGRVNKSESGRRVPSVEVQFLDDASKYWFPVADVRRWMADMVRAGSWERYNPGVPAPDFSAILSEAAAAEGGGSKGGGSRARLLKEEEEEEAEKAAAQALQSLSASIASSRRAGPTASGGTQPAVSSKRRRQQQDAANADAARGRSPLLQRSSSEVKRVGALDIMATAAGLRGTGSPPE